MPRKPARPRNRAQRQQAILTATTACLPHPLILRANILTALERVRPTSRKKDRLWYQEANESAYFLQRRTSATPDQAAGIIAALSPAMSYARNLQLARTLIRTGDCNHQYSSNTRKAQRILQGEAPTDVLGGNKVRAFYHNISKPTTEGHVTIDRHALQVALPGANPQILQRPGVYQLLAAAYRGAAAHHNRTANAATHLLPHELQAIVWCHHRRNPPAPGTGK